MAQNSSNINDSKKKFFYSPAMFMKDVRVLCQNCSQEHFDAILTIARGGLVLSGILANNLQIPEVYSIQLKSYTGCEQDGMKILYEPEWNKMTNKKLLVVDDLIDTGESIRVLKRLFECHQITEYKIAVLIDKQKNRSIQPDYFVRMIKEWVVFFWESGYDEYNDQ